MCRAALKPAGYRDEARPVHNEELGACAPDCSCGGRACHITDEDDFNSFEELGMELDAMQTSYDPVRVLPQAVVDGTPEFNVLDALMRNNSNRSFA